MILNYFIFKVILFLNLFKYKKKKLMNEINQIKNLKYKV